MGFQQGLSGLNASSKALDVISNNIANSATNGYKSQTAQFANVVAANWNAQNSQAGLGVAVSSVTSTFSQGNISGTSNPLDMAINGNGFFRMNTKGSISYSRDGAFQIDKNGYIVNSTGAQLTGYPASSSGALGLGVLGPLQIQSGTGAPSATTKMNVSLNLDSRATISAAPFDTSNAASYAYSSAMTAYDSLGNPRAVSFYYAHTSSGNWDVYATADGTSLGQIGTLAYDQSGALTSNPSVNLTLPAANGSQPVNATLSFEGSTQFGSSSGISSISQNGFAPGSLSNFNVAADGNIYGNYSNGQSKLLGQVALSSFAAPGGLSNLGNNQFGETAASGQPVIGSPGSGQMGVLQASSLENSNVDLTAQLVEMITAQRNYQANAQTIKTQDQIMQTLVNL